MFLILQTLSFVQTWRPQDQSLSRMIQTLAEPVGVRFGRHKYTTTALYYKGKFWNGQFTRSYEGSACVYIVSLITVACNYHTFTLTQLCLTITLLSFLMTIAEAKAPHTNDGPFLALIGCEFLSIAFFVSPKIAVVLNV